MGLFLLAAYIYMAAVSFRRERWVGRGNLLATAGLGLLTISLIIRWGATGHPPVMTKFENTVFGVWLLAALFLGFRRYWPGTDVLGLAVLPLAAVVMAYAVAFLAPELTPLAPAFKSSWLVLHFSFAWVAHAFFAVAAAGGLLSLLKGRAERRGRGNAILARIPAQGIMEDLIFGLIAFGFIAQTIMLLAGAIWARELWGAYWGWDPIETWSLITWLVYGLYLHLRVTWSWRGAVMSWLAMVAFATVLISFFSIGFISKLHI